MKLKASQNNEETSMSQIGTRRIEPPTPGAGDSSSTSKNKRTLQELANQEIVIGEGTNKSGGIILNK